MTSCAPFSKSYSLLARLLITAVVGLLATAALGTQATYSLTVQSQNPSNGVTVIANPADNSNNSSGSTTFTLNYNASTQVTLTAPSTASGNSLLYWQLDGTNQTSGVTTLTVTMNGPHTVVAVYNPPHTLTVQSQNPNNGVNITASPNDNTGASRGYTTFFLTYPQGTQATLTAPQFASGNTFLQWSVDGQTQPVGQLSVTVGMNADHTATAVYTSVYTLVVQSQNPNSGVNITASPADNGNNTSGNTQFSLNYNAGTVVTLTAPASVGANQFSNWIVDGQNQSAGQGTIAITMNGGHTATAVYVQVQTLTVASSNPNTGVTINASPADVSNTSSGTTQFSLSYVSNTQVTLTAPTSAPGGNGFLYWDVDGTNQTAGQNSLTVGMAADHTVTAHYGPVKVLTVQSQNPGSGVTISASPADNNGSSGGSTSFTLTYLSGTQVTLTAPSTSPTGSPFQRWTLDGVASSGTQLSVNMSAAHTAVAVYLGLQSLRASPDNLPGGQATSAIVAISGQAGPAGFGPISLSSDNPSFASPVVSSINIQPTFTRAKFGIHTTVVYTTTVVHISASYGGTTLQWTVTLQPATLGMTITPTNVIGGNPVTLSFTVSPQTVTDSYIPLSASTTTPLPNFPPSVFVPSGSTSATVQLATAGVDTPTPIQITAGSVAKTLTISPPTMRTFSLGASSLQGGATTFGLIGLNGKAGPSGYLVNFSSNVPQSVTVPGSLSIPNGSTSASFNVQTSPVSQTTNATISVTHGSVVKQASLTLTPLLLSSFQILPNPVPGGNHCTATVTLSDNALTDVQVSIRHTVSVLPITTPITVPAGSNIGTQRFATPAVAANVVSTVTATFNGVSISTKLTIVPATLSKLSISPKSVKGGYSTTGNLYLNALAPTGGAVINMTSSNSAVTPVISSATIPAGQQHVAFTISTKPVTTTQTVTITATYSRGGTVQATLTVTP